MGLWNPRTRKTEASRLKAKRETVFCARSFYKRGALQESRKGFAVAPILYILMLAGVVAGVLFSNYSQILRSNLSITNASIVKSDLQAGITTLSASATLDGLTQTVFCPPGGSGMSGACASAPNATQKLMQFGDILSVDAKHLPSGYNAAASSGTPAEVGVLKAGSGLKQLDPWGRFYIYCRWENARSGEALPALALISAGANGTLETACDGSGVRGDDQYVFANVGAAIQRASVWQTTNTEGGSNVEYGATGTKVVIHDDGTIEAVNLLLTGTATLAGANLLEPLPVASGGTGSQTVSGARINLGSGLVGDQIFTAGTIDAAQNALGATTLGKYLLSSGTLVSGSAALVREGLLESGVIGDAVFLAATATGARSSLGATEIGHYLFSSATYVPLVANDVRVGLLGAGGIGNTLFTTSDANTALTALGGTTVGIDVFTAPASTTARTALGAGTVGSSLFTAANQAQAWAILGLTGTGIPPLNVDITGNASNVTGIVAIPHGGTGASTASGALDNLFNGDGGPGLGFFPVTRLAAHSIDSSKLSTVIAEGTYNSVTVDASGRVIGGANYGNDDTQIKDGKGNSVVVSDANGGTLSFSTAGTTWMTLNSLGYLGLNTTTPLERLHVNAGNIRLSGGAGTTREIQFTSGTAAKRWVVATDGAGEIGNSSGSDFKIDRYTDAGFAANALTIARATGNASFNGQVSATGGFLGVFTGTFDGTFIGDIGKNVLLGTGPAQTNPHRDGDETTGLFSELAGAVQIATNGAERLRIASNGAVSVLGASAKAGSILDLSAATGTALSSLLLPKDTSSNRPVSGVAGMMRFNTTTNQFEGYDGSKWGNIGGSTAAANGQSFVTGWPDVIMCLAQDNVSTIPLYLRQYIPGSVIIYFDITDYWGQRYIQFNMDGSYKTGANLGNDCINKSKDDLVTLGRAFNTVNGSVAATASMTDGTAGAPGLYFDADPDTGLYRPAANTIGFSTGGSEKVRIDGSGAISIKGTAASAGAILDLGAATGTASSAMILPKDTSSNRPLSGVAGMIRFNTTTSQFEGYDGAKWGSLGGSTGAANGQSLITGAPDVILCNVTAAGNTYSIPFYLESKGPSQLVYRFIGGGQENDLIYNQSTGVFSSGGGGGWSNWTANDCATKVWSISQLITNGRAFNIVNGSVAATASIMDGTAGAPGLYFDADQDTGLYRPAANTMGLSTGGSEKVRIDGNGAISIKGASASAGAILDLGTATGTAASSLILPKDTSSNRPTTGVAGMMRFNTTTNTFEGYDGAKWESLGGSTAAANGQSLVNGYPDALSCVITSASGTANVIFYLAYQNSTLNLINYVVARAGGDVSKEYSLVYDLTGGFSSAAIGSWISNDCATKAWSISQLVANGRAFNIVNGSVAATASVIDGTAGAPGLYFDADQDTGLYRPAANTIGLSTGGSEKVRIDANGAISVKGATASAGAILDLGAATGTASSAIVLPKDTSSNRPTTGVAGMIRFNTTTSQFEGYNGSVWASIGQTAAANGQSLAAGFPDVISCFQGSEHWFLTIIHAPHSSGLVYYRTPGVGSYYDLIYTAAGAYSSNSNVAGFDCATKAWSISQLVANGRAFNIVNGSVAATASVIDGTAGAPGLYFDADQDTGIYRPAANTIGLSTGGIERVRIDASGAISVKGATANVGAILDLGAATGTTSSAMIVPKDTTANRPTTGVAGMIRFNTTTSQFEGYNGNVWAAIGQTAAANAQSIVSGWPDVLFCSSNGGAGNYAYILGGVEGGNVVWYENVYGNNSFRVNFDFSTGAYLSNINLYNGGTYNCIGKSVSELVAKGQAFNIVNGSVAATASVIDGTAGAPGLYFDADQDTGLYRPAANTIGLSTGGSEKVRIDANGAISIKGASASAGAILDLGAATGTASSAMIMPKDTTANRPTTGVAGMIRYNTTTNQFEGYNGSSWGSIGGSTAAANGQSLEMGLPDVLSCKVAGSGYSNVPAVYYLNYVNYSLGVVAYRYSVSAAGGDLNVYLQYNTTTGAYYASDISGTGWSSNDCINNGWSISQLVANGRAFNIVNGSVAATASVIDGTAGAPGLYFDADQDTGLYRPAANTIGLSTGGSEKVRIDANGAISVKSATASAGAILDLGAATGTAASAMVLPKDTSSNRPTTGVAGMIRFNTTTSQFEGYDGVKWGSLGGSTAAANGQSFTMGWPDVVVCNVTDPAWGKVVFFATHQPASDNLYYYRMVYSGNSTVLYKADGSFYGYQNITSANCNTSIAELVANGQAFNIVNGSVAATASVIDGTAGAPGLYFDADQDTGLYRPAANTIGLSTGGSEKVRIDGNGAISVKGASASAGAILDLGAATGTTSSAMIMPKDTTANRPTTGVAGMIRFNTTTNQFEGFDGSKWGNIAGGAAAANGQSLVTGWPDVLVCKRGGFPWIAYLIAAPSGDGKYHYRMPDVNAYFDLIYDATGDYNSNVGYGSTTDCVSNAWSISQLASNGRAFNIVNGSVAATASVIDGTAGAPGLYFDADQDTGLYRPAANTIGLSTGGSEKVRIDANGAISVKGASASAGAILDLGAATGTASSAMIMPKDTTANRPTTGVAGMIRFNTTTNQFEGYNGSAWSAIGQTAAANGQSLFAGWPDAVVCNITVSTGQKHPLSFYIVRSSSSDDLTIYRSIPYPGDTAGHDLQFRTSTGAFVYGGKGDWPEHDCVSNAWAMSQLIANGRAFNIVNGSVAATASVIDGTAGAPGLYFDADQDTGLYRPVANTIGLSTGGSEKVRVTAEGNVGIGSSTPAAPLTIANTDGRVFNPYGMADNEIRMGRIQSGNTVWDANGLCVGKTKTEGAPFCLGSNGGNMYFGTVLSENEVATRMRISPAGRLAIGASPTASLPADSGLTIYNDNQADAADDLSIYSYGGNYTPGLLLYRALGQADAPEAVPAGAALGSINFRGHDGTSFSPGAAINSHAETDWATEKSARLGFITVSAGAIVERMRITSAGRVGIGTGSPASQLDNRATDTTTANYNLARNYLTVTPSEANAGTKVASYNRINSTSDIFTGTLRGSQNEASYSGVGTMDNARGAGNHAYNNGIGSITNTYGTYSQAYNNSTGSIENSIGVFGFSGNVSTGYINNSYGGSFRMTNSVSKGNIGNARGINISLSNAGTITNTYGIYIESLTSGTQTNAPYAIYQAGAVDRNYFAGKVGIGTTSFDYPLQVGTTATNGAGAYLAPAGVWTNASDARLKENIRTISYGLEALMKLKPVAYEMKGTHEKQVGFIAQEVDAVVPEVVSVSKDGRYGLSYGNLLAVSVKAQQEMKLLGDARDEKLAALDAEMKHVVFKIESRLDTLEREMKAVNDNQDTRLTALEEENRKLREALGAIQKTGGAEGETRAMLRVVLWSCGGVAALLLVTGVVCGAAYIRARKRAA